MYLVTSYFFKSCRVAALHSHLHPNPNPHPCFLNSNISQHDMNYPSFMPNIFYSSWIWSCSRKLIFRRPPQICSNLFGPFLFFLQKYSSFQPYIRIEVYAFESSQSVCSKGELRINWIPVSKNNTTLKTGDIVSVSGRGRLKVSS